MNGICANCGTGINGKYCYACGQKAHIGRLSMHEIFHEIWHGLTHTDKGILKLIKDLFLHPKRVYENYFNGQRKNYFSPALFFLVTAGILVYLYGFVFDYQDKIYHTHNEFGRELHHLIKYKALMLLPVEALLTWLLFRKRFNLAEIITFWLFCLGFVYTVNIILIPLYFPLIAHKSMIDSIINILSYLIIFWHGGMALANKKLLSIIAFFILLNVIFVMDAALQLYMVFGNDLFAADNYTGVNNLWDLVKAAYSF
ncbi:MAG TPA: DUF3667 domain-containing protein [Mucilaginibacter sp.]|nr:DUF3667 domain-containing protein [Mucilaginibacter sp.]